VFEGDARDAISASDTDDMLRSLSRRATKEALNQTGCEVTAVVLYEKGSMGSQYEAGVQFVCANVVCTFAGQCGVRAAFEMTARGVEAEIAAQDAEDMVVISPTMTAA
jgi:hypothetical protein